MKVTVAPEHRYPLGLLDGGMGSEAPGGEGSVVFEPVMFEVAEGPLRSTGGVDEVEPVGEPATAWRLAATAAAPVLLGSAAWFVNLAALTFETPSDVEGIQSAATTGLGLAMAVVGLAYSLDARWSRRDPALLIGLGLGGLLIIGWLERLIEPGRTWGFGDGFAYLALHLVVVGVPLLFTAGAVVYDAAKQLGPWGRLFWRLVGGLLLLASLGGAAMVLLSAAGGVTMIALLAVIALPALAFGFVRFSPNRDPGILGLFRGTTLAFGIAHVVVGGYILVRLDHLQAQAEQMNSTPSVGLVAVILLLVVSAVLRRPQDRG